MTPDISDNYLSGDALAATERERQELLDVLSEPRLTRAEWEASIDWQVFADELVASGFRDGEMSTTLYQALLRALAAAVGEEEQ